ncbi:MAG TPA: acyl carrier protein [Mycobacteriales bacterium]|nr:acyl carrier protein [Mycobacteriales bacterium]
MAHHDPVVVVRNAVADTLGRPDHECDLGATLVGDLGLESLDLLDVFFRIERRIPVTLPLSWLSELLQGEVSDVDFCDARGVLTDRGLDRLRQVMPQVDPAEWSGQLRVEHIPELVTVGNLVDIVRTRAGLDPSSLV